MDRTIEDGHHQDGQRASRIERLTLTAPAVRGGALPESEADADIKNMKNETKATIEETAQQGVVAGPGHACISPYRSGSMSAVESEGGRQARPVG
jgi:hypothetical protein